MNKVEVENGEEVVLPTPKENFLRRLDRTQRGDFGNNRGEGGREDDVFPISPGHGCLSEATLRRRRKFGR